MSLVQIPYQFYNGIENADCETKTLTIDTSNFSLCGDKYFALRIEESSTLSDGTILNTFSYNENTYGNSSLSTDNLIILLASAFVCSPSYGCPSQVASFNWLLTPMRADSFNSTTILDDVSSTNRIYTITTITVNAVNYGVLPYTVWNDATEGMRASENANAYFQEIINYLATLSIPEFQGGVNLGVDGASDNFQGVNLLQLYFDSGIAVTINTASNSGLTGTFTSTGADVTSMLELTLTNTSTIDASDLVETTQWIVTDGNETLANSTTPIGTLYPYNTLCDGCSLDTSKGFVINLVLVTEQRCDRNNLATAVIPSAEIIDSITNNVVKNGSSPA